MVKNRLFLILFIAGVLLTLFLGKPVSQMPTGEVINLGVSNAGFEGGNGADAYSWTETANIKRTDSRFRSGSYSMIAKYTMALYAGEASYSNAIDVKPNTKYILSGYIYNRFMQGQAYTDIKAYGGTNDPAWSCDAKSTLDSCEWQFVSCEFTTPNDVTKVQIRAIADKYPWGMSWFDDIELTTEENRCSDSDNGEVVEILGTVTEYSSGLPYSYTDYCRIDGYLNEYYCTGTRAYDRAYDCTTSTGAPCADGVCTTTTTTSTTTTTLPSYYDDFSSSSLDSNKWEIRQDPEGQPFMDEFYVDSSLKNYHTKQNTIADKRVYLVPKHKFKAGDSIEYDVDVVSKEGHYGNIILLVGEECSRCALGMVGYSSGPQPYDELGVSHMELNFFSDKLQIIRKAPSGQIFNEEKSLQNPDGIYELYIGSFSGHNGKAHIDYDNFIITPQPILQTQTQVFYDDFESDLSKWMIVSDSPSLSPEQFYTKQKSVKLSTETRLYGSTQVLSDAIVEAYFFDTLINDGHDIGIIITPSTNAATGRIEIVPGISKSYYVAVIGDYRTTSVPRTYGWHKARFELANSYLNLYIDDIFVRGGVPPYSYFDKIYLINTGPASGPIYFDDIYVYQTSQTSQATLDYARTIASMPPPPPSATNSTG